MLVECAYRFTPLSNIGYGKYDLNKGTIEGIPKELFFFKFRAYSNVLKDVRVGPSLPKQTFLEVTFSTTACLVVLPYYDIGSLLIYKDRIGFALNKDKGAQDFREQAMPRDSKIFEGSIVHVGISGTVVKQYDIINGNTLLTLLDSRLLAGEEGVINYRPKNVPVNDIDEVTKGTKFITKALASGCHGLLYYGENKFRSYKIKENKLKVEDIYNV